MVEDKREFIVDQMNVYSKEVVGCVKNNKDIMISFKVPNGDIIDLYLTQEAAIEFQKKLTRNISFNELEI
tara:strand:- start:10526 stop:10735 length:210 start_codon:yes stop_codon:yes gene_type:complete